MTDSRPAGPSSAASGAGAASSVPAERPGHARSGSLSASRVFFHVGGDEVDEAHGARPSRRPSLSVSVGSGAAHPPAIYHHNQAGQHGGLEPPEPLSPAAHKEGAQQRKEHKLVHHASDADLDPSLYSALLTIINTHDGLDEATVEAQRAKHGFNETIEKQKPLILVFLSKFWGATPIMIMAAMGISYGLQHWVDGSVIGALLLVNGCIAFHEDLRARKALSELVKQLQVMARVKRAGEWSEIAARLLVPGDLVRIRTGDIVGADIVLLNGDVAVDASALTGESAIKNRSRHALLYAGSIIKRGEANGIVVATGASTYFGQTSKLVQSSKPNPHIERILNRIVGMLMSFVIALITITLIILGVRGDDVVEALPLLLMVIITALPVALPAMFTVAMALGSQELSQKKVLITRLNVLEDCALMSILFSDKTGTLTQNHLSVKRALPLFPGAVDADVLLGAALCSKTENADPIDMAILEEYALSQGATSSKSDSGSPHKHNADAAAEGMDAALMQTETPGLPRMAQSSAPTLFPSTVLTEYVHLHFAPFDASNRRTESVVKMADSEQLVYTTKGAAATLFALCGIPAGSEQWNQYDSLVQGFAAKGQRTIAVARATAPGPYKPAGPRKEDDVGHDVHSAAPVVNSGLKWELLGLIALFDPPRPDSKAIVRSLLDLGIRTKMLTGDAMGVACETGDLLGMGRAFVNLEHEKLRRKQRWKEHQTLLLEDETEDSALIKEAKIDMTGTGGAEVSDESLDSRILAVLLTKHDPLAISGFAQIFPSDKHYIVEHTQEKGYVCGMTGDGANDAPALKQAEVGCAVSNATDVAKGSASAVLLADGLSGVVDMVKVGRAIHRRVAVWVMNKVSKASMHSCFILIVFLILGRFPISALQVVVMLLLMDFVLVSLATDNQEPGDMPETWNLAQLARIGLIPGLLGAGQMLFVILMLDARTEWDIEKRHTMAFEMMFLMGMLAVFSVRERRFFFHSRPSNVLLGVVSAESFAVWIVCAVGTTGFPGLGWGYSTAVLGGSLICSIFNDFMKTMYIRTFEKSVLGGGVEAQRQALRAEADREQEKGHKGAVELTTTKHVEASPVPPQMQQV